MKQYLFLSMLLTTTAFAEQLHNYDQIKSTIEKGREIRLYIDYTKCVLPSKNLTLPNNSATYTPNAMAINTAGEIGSYLLYFTMNDPHYLNKPVYQFFKFVISPNNILTMTSSVLNAADYSFLQDEGTVKCNIDNGVNIFTSTKEDA